MTKIIKCYHCLRCDKDWYPRKPGRPERCGKCKSPYWNVPRTVGS